METSAVLFQPLPEMLFVSFGSLTLRFQRLLVDPEDEKSRQTCWPVNNSPHHPHHLWGPPPRPTVITGCISRPGRLVWTPRPLSSAGQGLDLRAAQGPLSPHLSAAAAMEAERRSINMKPSRIMVGC